MNIVHLSASNFMNLEVIDITPDEHTVVLSGKNGAGKSSVLNAIVIALSGKALGAIPKPVRHGAKSGDVVLDLGEMVVKRHFTNNNSSLRIENKEGMIFKSPQAMLDKLRGNISFDPLEFAGLPEKIQKDVLLELVDLPIDLDELDEQRKEIYQNRTMVNRDINQLEGSLAGIPDIPDIPDDEISAVDVMADMQAATEQITENNNIRSKLTAELDQRVKVKAEQEQVNADILKLQDHAEHIKIDLATSNHTIATMKDNVAELVDPDLEQFKCQLEDVETTNAKVRKKQERNRILSQLTETRGISLGMTVDITKIDELKSQTIQEADMPIMGLGFDENGVTFGDVPLSQRSDGEKRKISVAIGMALNPDLKVLWMKDASLLDSESIDAVKAMAVEHDYQLWLEVVKDDGNGIGIHIEEGKVIS